MTNNVSRRGLLFGAGVIGAAAAVSPKPAATQTPQGQTPQGQTPQRPTYRFFNPAEAAFIEAATDRLIPPDESWPGAVGAGVPSYIDQELAGPYGQGARLYLAGPWKQGLPTQGYQLPMTPAQLYRRSLQAIGDFSQSRNFNFGAAPPEAQDSFLRDLEANKIPFPGYPSAEFFETLLANTIEGFFSDPLYGGNRDMVGWRMIGFPGAYAAYLNVYTNHGVAFTREPMSIGQHPGGGGDMPGGMAGMHRHG